MPEVRLAIVSINLENYVSPVVHILKKYAAQSKSIAGKFSIDVFDFKISDSEDFILKQLSGYQVVCFSAYLWNVRKVTSLVKTLKTRHIILGGPEINNNLPYYQNNKTFGKSIFVLGSGENAFPEALADYLRGKSRKIYHSPDQMDLSRLPEVYSSLDFRRHISNHVRFRKEKVKLVFATSSGCAYKCAYCTWGNKKITFFPDAYVHKELKWLLSNPHAELVYIADSDICVNKKRAISILKTINEFSRNDALDFIYLELNPMTLDSEITNLLGQNRKIISSFGLQTSDKKVMACISRGMNIKKYRKGITLFKKTGKPFFVDIILGLPGDTRKTFLKTLDFAFSLGTTNINIFPLYVLPGSMLYEKAAEFGLKHSRIPPYKIISSHSMPSLKKMEVISVWLQILLCFDKVIGALNSVPGRRRIDVYTGFIEFLLKTPKLAKEHMSIDYRKLTDISRFYTPGFEAVLSRKCQKFIAPLQNRSMRTCR